MPRPRHPVTRCIDEAVALLQKHGVPITLGAVRINVKKHLTWADLPSDQVLNDVIDLRLPSRLRQLGFVITDEDSRTRQEFKECTASDWRTEVEFKERNASLVNQRLEVDQEVLNFLEAKESENGQPVKAGDFIEEIEAIYEEHGVAA